jgi:polyferredoxin
MKEWVKRRVEQEPKAKASCEVCHTAFLYRTANQRHFDCDQLQRHYQRNKKSVLTFFLVYALFWLVWLGILALVASSKSNEGMPLYSFVNQSAGMTIMASILAIYVLGMLVVTILLISEYFVREDVVISRVCNYYEPKNNFKNMRIHFKISP